MSARESIALRQAMRKAGKEKPVTKKKRPAWKDPKQRAAKKAESDKLRKERKAAADKAKVNESYAEGGADKGTAEAEGADDHLDAFPKTSRVDGENERRG